MGSRVWSLLQRGFKMGSFQTRGGVKEISLLKLHLVEPNFAAACVTFNSFKP